MIGYIFLIIILVILGIIFLIMEGKLNKDGKRRNAWDIMFFNTILAIVILFYDWFIRKKCLGTSGV